VFIPERTSSFDFLSPSSVDFSGRIVCRIIKRNEVISPTCKHKAS